MKTKEKPTHFAVIFDSARKNLEMKFIKIKARSIRCSR